MTSMEKVAKAKSQDLISILSLVMEMEEEEVTLSLTLMIYSKIIYSKMTFLTLGILQIKEVCKVFND